MNAEQKKLAVAAAGVVGVGAFVWLFVRKRAEAAPSSRPDVAAATAIATTVPSSPGQPPTMSPSDVKRPGPGPFDPVSSDWKRSNAPDWWPW